MMAPAGGKVSSSRRSWANTALLALFGVTAGIMALLIAASFFVPPVVDRWVETYTDAAPMGVAAPPIEDAEREVAQARLDAFVDGLEEGSGGDAELVLDEDELRALIAAEQDVARPRIGMELELLPGRIRVAVSVPIEDDVPLGPWQAETKGRYLNGYATIAVSFSDGDLEMELESVETVEGKPFPGWATALLNRELERAWESEDTRDVLDKLDRLEIREGALVLRGKS